MAYVANERRPDMLHGRILRSTLPHGLIRRVDTATASGVPGVMAIVTGQDVPGGPRSPRLHGLAVRDTPVLAVDRVRYVGEPIAAVAAIDPDAAEEALRRIVVTLEPLLAAFAVEDAEAPYAVPIHSTGNLVGRQALRAGDVDEALRGSDVVVSERFVVPPVQGVPLESHAVLVEWTSGGVVVYTASQTPFHVQRELAHLFELPLERVRVITRTLGGGFGAKAYSRIEPIAVLLAQRARRPVKIVLSRSEEFITVQRQPAVVTMTTGARRDGRLLALRATCTFAAGPYVDNTLRVLRHGIYSLVGPYRIEALDLVSRGVHTNMPPCGPLRAPGTAQITWAREAHLDAVAQRVGIDPYELRRRNLVTEADRFVLGGPMGPVHLDSLLAAVRLPTVEERRSSDLPSARRGVGYALALKTTATPSRSEAVIELDGTGRVAVLTSTVELGQGASTALAQIAADGLTVPLSRVELSPPDTGQTPPDDGTVSSRSTFSMGTAIVRAADRLKSELLELAERRLEIARHDLVIVDGRVRPIDGSSDGLELADLVRGTGGRGLAAGAEFTNEVMRDPMTGEAGVSTHHHQAAASACVEVDLETGAVAVLEVRVATHAGIVVNPTLAELQLEGNVAFGVGQALMEESLFDAGQMQNPSLADYLIPSIADMPGHLTVKLQEGASGEIHGIGESALPAVVPAVTNAVAQAIGGRLHTIPATPERVLRVRRTVSLNEAVE